MWGGGGSRDAVGEVEGVEAGGHGQSGEERQEASVPRIARQPLQPVAHIPVNRTRASQ